MAQKFVGIDLGNRKVKVVVAAAGLRGAQVISVWEQDVAPDKPSEGGQGDPLDAAIDTALRMLGERGLRHLPTGVSLPGDAGSYRVLSFPFDDPRQIAQALSFELDGQFPVPIEELVTDHIVIKRGDGKGRALVVAVKRAMIEHVTARFSLANIDLKVVTTGVLGLAQALASTPVPPLPPGTTGTVEPLTLVVDFGDKSTELVALASTGPVAARTMRRGGRQLRRELEKAWRLDGQSVETVLQRDASCDDPIVRRALQPLLREIEHTRQWLKAELGGQVVELRLAGGVARLRGLDRWLAHETKLDTALVMPKESGALKHVLGRDWTSSLVALGTAVAAGRRPLIQLLDAFEGSSGEGMWVQQHFSSVAALGIAIVAFAGVDTMVRLRAAERERDAYAEELERETLAVFGSSLATRDEIQAKLDEAEGGASKNLIPERGALEVLELVTKSATPKGGRPAPTGLPPGYTQGIGPDGSPAIIGPDGSPAQLDPTGQPIIPPPSSDDDGEEGGEGGENAQPEGPRNLPPVPSDAGVVADDELVFSSVDIRELKIDLGITATRATAQDRLAAKLADYTCVRDITKGMTRDRNDRVTFEMSIDHNCYFGNVGTKGGVTEETDG
jgi:Tfp pilus assembly PilM family ATPase